jgi:hypothetical protein
MLRLSVLALMPLMTAAPLPEREKSPWLNDVQAAQALAARAGKPILAVLRCEH